MQRWAYAAAVLTALHGASLHDWGNPWPAVLQFSPLIGLCLYRLWWLYLRPRPLRIV